MTKSQKLAIEKREIVIVRGPYPGFGERLPHFAPRQGSSMAIQGGFAARLNTPELALPPPLVRRHASGAVVSIRVALSWMSAIVRTGARSAR